MKSIKKIVMLVGAITLAPASSEGKTIIWDLGDTLFEVSQLAIARKVGLAHFIFYMILDRKSPNIKPIVFDVLERISPSTEKKEGERREIPTDNEGHPLPIIMHKWLAGIIPPHEIVHSINDYLDHLYLQGYFSSKRQKRLVQKLLEQMFNPDTLVQATRPIEEGINLLHDCCSTMNTDGTPKNRCFILSNWDEVSFELLKKKFHYIFDRYFTKDRIVISGAIGLIKPTRDAFEYMLKTYKLDPGDCIFIDDSYANIYAAQETGMYGIQANKKDYQLLRKFLESMDVL